MPSDRFGPYLDPEGPEVLLLAVLAVIVLAVPILGGRLRALADLHFRHVWAVATALGVQLLIIVIVPTGLGDLYGAIHTATYAFSAFFVIANRQIPGVLLIGLGGALNLAPIAANGGVMPASREALATAGLAVETGEFENSTAVAGAKLAFLGDVFALPASVPLANVFSVGDLIVVTGAGYAIHRICGSRLVPSRRGELAALRAYPAFARLWLAHGVSCLGDWVYAVAVFASVADRGLGAGAIATLLLVQVGPAAVAGVLGGPLIDRLPRRRLMIAADLVRAGAVGSLVVIAPSFAHFVLVAACLGVCGALFGPSLHASLPNVVPKERLVAANALITANFHLAVSAGPVLGGLLAARLGGTPAFALNAGTFLVSAALVARVALPDAPAGAGEGSAVAALRDGLRHCLATPMVRGVMLVTGVVMFAAGVRTPLEPPFVFEALGESPEALGLLGGAWGLGMVVGSAAAPAVMGWLPRQAVLAASLALVGGGVVAASQARVLMPVLGLFVVCGVGNAFVTIAYETLLQERTPDALRGRVIAASEAVVDGSLALGLVAAGAVAGVLGVRSAFAASGLALVAAAVLSVGALGMRSPVRLGDRLALRASGGTGS